MKNYKLIYYFVTAPICKDPSTIGKILSMLTENIVSGTPAHLFNQCDMRHYEKIISEVHYKKLMLLSKIIMKVLTNDTASDFRFIETNPKK